MMMDVALFDEGNPIMEWLSSSMSESAPVLDEYDGSDDDWTTPGGFLIDELGMQPAEVAAFKRKLALGRKGGKKKGKVGLEEEEELYSDESDSSEGSPIYNDSASDDENDGDDVIGGDGSGGGTACGKGGGDGGSSSRAHGGAAGVRIGKPFSIRPRSNRKKKPTLKSVYKL